MISVYDFTDYREYLLKWIESNKHSHKGLQGKLAEAAGISSSLISFILKGTKHLSLEQAAEISEFIGLTENENEFFYLLVEYGKAGSFKLKQQLKKRISLQSKKLSNRISQKVDLSDEIKSIYYSNWIYAGIRNLTSLPGHHDVQTLSKRLGLSAQVTGNALDFLLQHGLCKIVEGSLTYSTQRTHVQADSPFVLRHHQNWRLKGFQSMEQRKTTDIFFTGPMSLSEKAVQEIQQLLPKVVEQVMGIAGPSDSEKLYCFNLDWFEY